LNLSPGRKHIKCAKICGDTSGNYHPHGESVIYPTLVGMAQSWKMSVPLVQPQGNFGSIDGDPPAAMRYTEARMTQAAVDMLADIKLDTVDFQPNYDDRLEEPMVLPGKFPNLLINGGLGIAVGMATSLPPHNPREIFDAIERVVDDASLTAADLMRDEVDEAGNVTRRGVVGPDFPTGGVILGRRGIAEAYLTGRGKVPLRGACHVEPISGKTDREQLVIDSIPYNLVQNTLVERIVEAIKDERIKDVSDVRNESGREARTRIVVELKKGADARVVENQLYQFTPLQQTFSIMNIALVNRQPRTLGLRELIGLYLDHRRDVIRRRTEHLLREAKKKAHLLEGLIYAVCDIDEVIALIRSSKTRPEAIDKLMSRRFRIAESHEAYASIPQRLKDHVAKFESVGGVALTRVQAEAIGAMRLIQLVGLEIERLVNDYTAIVAEIEDYEDILADPERVSQIIRDDLGEMRERYDRPRLTSIEESAGDIDIAELIPEGQVAVTISHAGYAKRVPLDTYRSQGRGGKGIRAGDSKDDDSIEHLFVSSTHDDLLVFTDTGRVFKLKVYEVPEMSRTSKGRAMINLIDMKPGENARSFLTVKDFEAHSLYLTFVTRNGLVKRTPLKAYRNVNRSGLIALGLRDGDSLLSVRLTTGNDDLLLVTAAGMAIRFNEDDERGGLRDTGRQASGVKGIDLAAGNHVVGVVQIPMTPINPDATEPEKRNAADLKTAVDGLQLLTVTQHGYGKQTPVDQYRVSSEDGTQRSQSRGGKGRNDIKTTPRNGPAVAAVGVMPGDDIVVISKGGQLVRLAGDSVSSLGRGTQGVRVVSLKSGDAVVAVAPVPAVDDEVEAGGEAEPAAEA
ncbi:MAG: DNA gyrase subunit A, partial [Planctomycetota bacterium]